MTDAPQKQPADTPPQPAPAPAPASETYPMRTLRLPFPLQDHETITLLARKHWWYLWPLSILWVLFAIVPVIAGTIILDIIGILGDLGMIWWGIAILWVVYWAIRLLLNWYRYHNDLWLVTNQRIVDSFKKHPWNLRVATADLVNIQDMSVVKNGPIESLLNFGDVVCETAGAEHKPFLISGVPRPEQVQLLIDRERDRMRKDERSGRAL
jgi:hypothetical protein